MCVRGGEARGWAAAAMLVTAAAAHRPAACSGWGAWHPAAVAARQAQAPHQLTSVLSCHCSERPRPASFRPSVHGPLQLLRFTFLKEGKTLAASASRALQFWGAGAHGPGRCSGDTQPGCSLLPRCSVPRGSGGSGARSRAGEGDAGVRQFAPVLHAKRAPPEAHNCTSGAGARARHVPGRQAVGCTACARAPSPGQAAPAHLAPGRCRGQREHS